jgi:hypothetical protein
MEVEVEAEVKVEVEVAMILKALKAGWTVSMNDKEELVFTKAQRNMKPEERTEVFAEGFSAKFLQSLIAPVKKHN